MNLNLNFPSELRSEQAVWNLQAAIIRTCIRRYYEYMRNETENDWHWRPSPVRRYGERATIFRRPRKRGEAAAAAAEAPSKKNSRTNFQSHPEHDVSSRTREKRIDYVHVKEVILENRTCLFLTYEH